MQRSAADLLICVLHQDATGLWSLAEAHGLFGGRFKTREQAVRFAKFEAAGRPLTISVPLAPLAA